MTLYERFAAKTAPCPSGSACIVWTGATKKPSRRDGRGGQSLPHGVFRVGGSTAPAHRVAYMFAHGYEGCTLEYFGLIEHTCDNPRCVNSEHLIEGDASSNLKAAYARGRRLGHAALASLCAWWDEHSITVDGPVPDDAPWPEAAE